MNEQASRYPLSWPQGWARTKPFQRQRATFRSSRQSSYVNGQGQTVTSTSAKALTVSDAIKLLSGELSRLGATNEMDPQQYFPHVCAGTHCAICRWVLNRVLNKGWRQR